MTNFDEPGYWMNEESGVLAPVIGAYLANQKLNSEQIGMMRAYLKHWIDAPGFRGPEVDQLRGEVDGLETREDLEMWLDDAIEAGVDPL